jgi:hypothetical protein
MKPLKSQSTRIKNKIGRQKRREKGRKEAKKNSGEGKEGNQKSRFWHFSQVLRGFRAGCLFSFQWLLM